MKTREVAGFPGYYVDRVGNVFSQRTRWGVDLNKWNKLAPNPDTNGYLQLDLYCGEGTRHGTSKRIHIIVLETWKGPKPDSRYECRHIDGNKLNNNITNLRWGLPKTNARDRMLHGRQARGSTHGLHKLVEADIPRIRARLAAGDTQQNIAAGYGLAHSSISDIKLHKTWKHVA